MIINLDNLSAGLSLFAEKWGQDILNAEYYKIYEDRSEGPTEQWWSAAVERLTKWHAYRGRKPPNTKKDIYERGVRCLDKINAQFQKLMRDPATEPSIADRDWEGVAPLFALAYGIKHDSIEAGSPVFPSKMCHFLFPKLFTVMDNEVTGVFEYEFYWRGMKDEWRRFTDKDEARNIITKAINSAKSHTLHPLYPFETKIIELSHMGYNAK